MSYSASEMEDHDAEISSNFTSSPSLSPLFQSPFRKIKNLRMSKVAKFSAYAEPLLIKMLGYFLFLLKEKAPYLQARCYLYFS